MDTLHDWIDDMDIQYAIESRDKKIFIRDIKLKMVVIENNISLIKTRFEFKDNRKHYQKLVEEFASVGIVCGSFSLFVHGLIDRPPKDIDLLVDRHSEVIKSFIKRNEKRINQFRCDKKSSFNNVVDSFEPVEQFKTKDIMVDMFHDIDVKFIEYNGIKVQCPFQVIQKKIDIYDEVSRTKDLDDLKLISKRLDVIIEAQEDRLGIDIR